MRPQNDSTEKVEANPATTAASNSHRNEVENVLEEPEVRCTELPHRIVRKENKRSAVKYWAGVSVSMEIC
jgi:hypothetical protein